MAHPDRARPTITNKTLIDQRPASAETKLEAGHWEEDLILGVGSASAMVTLRERTTQYGVIVCPMTTPPPA